LTKNLAASKVCPPKLHTVKVAVIVSPANGMALEMIFRGEVKRTSAGRVGGIVGVDVGVGVSV
jgi:hypothetical protein